MQDSEISVSCIFILLTVYFVTAPYFFGNLNELFSETILLKTR